MTIPFLSIPSSKNGFEGAISADRSRRPQTEPENEPEKERG